ncbi:MAG: ATP-grasp domain-containing protein [Chloroflexi bacterium]|nr:ATP-grasp domain-containing protein [Chloroflexota bacterium]
MKIGFTYDLRSKHQPDENSPADYYGEYESDETVAGITEALITLGHEVIQIGNISALVNFLGEGNRVDLVFNMAEGRYGRTRESQVPSLLEAYQIPYTFSDSLTLAICLDKGRTKEILERAQIPTPAYQILKPETNIQTMIAFPLFVKPLYEGTSKGINENSVIYAKDKLIERTKWLWSEYKQPVLLEKYLPGREFTVGILGTGKDARVLGMMEVLLNEGGKIYGFQEKENYTRLVSYKFDIGEALYEKLAKMALASWRTLECRDGGRVDIRLDEKGNPHVLELNTLPGLHLRDSDLTIIAHSLGMSFIELVDEILHHAMKRMK